MGLVGGHSAESIQLAPQVKFRFTVMIQDFEKGKPIELLTVDKVREQVNGKTTS